MKREITPVFLLLTALFFMSGFAWLAPPANDDLANATTITSGSTTLLGNTTEATSEVDESGSPCATIDDQQSIWWSYSPSSTGTMTLSVDASSFAQTTVSVWTIPSSIQTHPMNHVGCTNTSTAIAISSTGTRYYIRVSGDSYFGSPSKEEQGRGQVQRLAGDAIVGFAGPSGLPVELLYFDALVDGSTAELRWTTATESNNSGFDVQWKSSARDWSSLDFVNGAGSTTEQQDYSFTISDLTPDRYFFRLKQVDFDGGFEFSPVIEARVDVPSTHHLANAYPNPFNPQTQFSLTVAESQQVSVKLFDQQGRELRSLFTGELEAGIAQTISIDGSDLSSGTYIYQVTGANFTESKTVSLVK